MTQAEELHALRMIASTARLIARTARPSEAGEMACAASHVERLQDLIAELDEARRGHH